MLSDGLVRFPAGSPRQNAWSFPRFPMPAFHRAQTKAAPRPIRRGLILLPPMRRSDSFGSRGSSLCAASAKDVQPDSRLRRNRWAGLTVSPRLRPTPANRFWCKNRPTLQSNQSVNPADRDNATRSPSYRLRQFDIPAGFPRNSCRVPPAILRADSPIRSTGVRPKPDTPTRCFHRATTHGFCLPESENRLLPIPLLPNPLPACTPYRRPICSRSTARGWAFPPSATRRPNIHRRRAIRRNPPLKTGFSTQDSRNGKSPRYTRGTRPSDIPRPDGNGTSARGVPDKTESAACPATAPKYRQTIRAPCRFLKNGRAFRHAPRRRNFVFREIRGFQNGDRNRDKIS